MLLYFTFSVLFFVNKKYFLVISIIYTIFFLLFLTEIYGSGFSHSAFFSGLFSFLIGCVFCGVYLKNRNFFKNSFYNISYYILIILFFTELFVYKSLFRLDYSFIYSFFFGLMIYLSCFLNKNYFIYKLFFNEWFIYLGKISYSIYLGHVFVFYFLNNFLKFVIGYPVELTPDLKVSVKLSVLESNVYVLLAYLLTILLASFTYKFIEKKYYKKI